ncbi:hypothetical protein AAFF_G00425860 [Aldrovandia affinis]|uniref:Uncharacterized protein n=1 Tax=Aldrovandia affinis TaxID=143900 RepID=A0AAD7T731_9TELE|nr:hypothetical protein AAFF_G00425860 [Aldrovandia affinis]
MVCATISRIYLHSPGQSPCQEAFTRYLSSRWKGRQIHLQKLQRFSSPNTDKNIPDVSRNGLKWFTKDSSKGQKQTANVEKVVARL